MIPVKANIEVFTANEAPPDQLIPFHHELAQVQNPPQYLFFYCDLPSDTGGETALIDSTLGKNCMLVACLYEMTLLTMSYLYLSVSLCK